MDGIGPDLDLNGNFNAVLNIIMCIFAVEITFIIIILEEKEETEFQLAQSFIIEVSREKENNSKYDDIIEVKIKYDILEVKIKWL